MKIFQEREALYEQMERDDPNRLSIKALHPKTSSAEPVMRG